MKGKQKMIETEDVINEIFGGEIDQAAICQGLKKTRDYIGGCYANSTKPIIDKGLCEECLLFACYQKNCTKLSNARAGFEAPFFCSVHRRKASKSPRHNKTPKKQPNNK